MKINVASWDRAVRFVFGVLLLGWFLAGGAWWGLAGLYLLITAAWGWCALYSMFRFQSFRPPSLRIEG